MVRVSMKRQKRVLTGLFGCAMGLLAACGEPKQAASVDLAAATSAPLASTAPAAAPTVADGFSKEFNPRLLRRFKAVRAHLHEEGQVPSQAMVDLGRMLYFEKRISAKAGVSCNSCHPLDRFGADGEVTSLGQEGKRGTRNSPTVYHSAGYFAQFWDGRALNVEEQAKSPILNVVEMGMKDGKQVESVLKKIPGYGDAFARAFPGEKEPVSYDNLGKAIGAFERGLVTPSRWDKYLEGDKTALTAEETEGLRVFTNVGCMVCHTGEFVGGSMFSKVGAVEPWPNQNDQGRFEVTKKTEDKMMFKVPTLRNVAKTAPYFHDGSAADLTQAVKMMGKHQLGLDLAPEEVASIVAWLSSLTGTLPAEYITAPKLPGS
jgi:cytochrome c peroxidase